MYANLKEIYRKTNLAMWNMSVAYLLDYGVSRVVKITDEEIESLEENGLMTQDFVQDLVRTAREIARECENNVVEIIQFCMVEECFDTKWYTGNEEEEWED